MYIESISGLVAIHSVHKQFVPAHLANEQATSAKQILFFGVMTPALLPECVTECVIVIVNDGC